MIGIYVDDFVEGIYLTRIYYANMIITQIMKYSLKKIHNLHTKYVYVIEWYR